MAIEKIARPFTLNHGFGRVQHRYGVGVYTIDDALAAHPYIRHHTEAATRSRGETLIQHRSPGMPNNPTGSVYSMALSVVTDILPQEVRIWRWPPGPDSGHFPFNDYVIEAPGELVTVRTRDGREEMRVLQRSIPPHRWIPHGTPASVPLNPFAAAFPAGARLGDTIVFGLASTGAPLKLDTPPQPKPDAMQVALMQRQAEVTALAQTNMSGLLREAAINAARTMAGLPLARIDLDAKERPR